MNPLLGQTKIKREGERQISDPTDSEYYDKRLARMVQELKECPKEWKETYLLGIDVRDLKAMKERGLLK